VRSARELAAGATAVATDKRRVSAQRNRNGPRSGRKNGQGNGEKNGQETVRM